ncbi:unnamed protein product [Kuraishia capsulata CBS 1993]|uniref:Uncharacterized protein n=1 Tax=Kuraishia capsulata CBS 1993 TaxID=1382522 RepID=W6MUB0_9ASCO|nr:uncharacterized protein KUCA_T00005059001 [Kuraishia capsulata CBS 1993]CDK29072.1 unnamed protein product [Kuraishia capsulata CBS 1993]
MLKVITRRTPRSVACLGLRFNSGGPPKEYKFDPAAHHEVPKDQQQKYESQQRYKAVLLGIAAFGGAIGAFQVYNNYGWVRAKITGHSGFQSEMADQEAKARYDLKKKQELKQQLAITDPNDSTVPGLYVCGSNEYGIISADKKVKFQTILKRVPFFDGMLLRDVKLGDQSACAIDSKGNLFQWGKNFDPKGVEPRISVKGLGLVKCEISNGAVYALAKDGSVYYFPESSEEQKQFKVESRNAIGIKSTKHYQKLKLEKAKDIAAGDQHLVMLSSTGKVFTMATGFKNIEKSNGQFGSTKMTQFDTPPLPNVPIEVSLLNRFKDDKTGEYKPRLITQIAAGKFHTLALDNLGYVWSFGHNVYGSLGKHVAYNTEIIPYPSKVELFSAHFKKDDFPQCVNIAAGGFTSFATFVSSNIYKLFEESLKGKKRTDFSDLTQTESDSQLHLSWGKGLKGELGTSHFTHSQPEPAKMKILNSLKDYNEENHRLESTKIKSWSVGESHVLITLDSGDVYAWGDNEYGQLGNGKRVRSAAPFNPPALVEPQDKNVTLRKLENVNNRLTLKSWKKYEQSVVAGSGATGLYYKPL